METEKSYNEIIHEYFGKEIFFVARCLRIDFLGSGLRQKFNAVITFIMFCLGIYTILFNIKITLSSPKLSSEMASQLLIILWAIQSLISLVFLLYWQLNGLFSHFRQKLAECQGLRGLKSQRGKRLMRRTVQLFYFLIFLTLAITVVLSVKFHMEEKHSEMKEKQSFIFYYSELRPVYTFITTYLYIILNMTLFILIIYTNATYLEIQFFNENIEQFDGSVENADEILLNFLEIFRNLCVVIRQLDLIFRFYTFTMIVITIPSMIFTLMMMNTRIHSFIDLLLCLPTIILCAFTFFSVTIAPARLHDEISKTKGFFCQNKSIWFPFREKIYLISNTFLSHMEQFDLGVSVWGFAILSRSLILGTLSATVMMLSLLTELAPNTDLLSN